jgi:hypothetical protein
MARLPETFNFGDRTDIDMEELLLLLDRMYIDLAEAINQKPDLYQRMVDGQASDTFLAQGSININLNTDKVEMLTNHTSPTNVTWTQIS